MARSRLSDEISRFQKSWIGPYLSLRSSASHLVFGFSIDSRLIISRSNSHLYPHIPLKRPKRPLKCPLTPLLASANRALPVFWVQERPVLPSSWSFTLSYVHAHASTLPLPIHLNCRPLLRLRYHSFPHQAMPTEHSSQTGHCRQTSHVEPRRQHPLIPQHRHL